MDKGLLDRIYDPVWLGSVIEYLEEVTSTNDVAMERLADLGREAHGRVIIAERQTAGRGRVGRRWHTRPGRSVTLSVALWSDGPRGKDLALLPIAGALAVRTAVSETTGLDCRLKWPNDVLLNGKKVAGCLMEARWSGDTPSCLVLGVGVNLNQESEDFPPELREEATSLRLETGCEQGAELFIASLLTALEPILDEAPASPGLLAALASPSWVHVIGEPMEARLGRRVLRGVFKGIDEGGTLFLLTARGLEGVRYGEVSRLRRLS